MLVTVAVLAGVAGVGIGFLGGSLLATRFLGSWVPAVISKVGEALLTPGAVEDLPQNPQVSEDLFKDLQAQLEAEPLPASLDWMEE